LEATKKRREEFKAAEKSVGPSRSEQGQNIRRRFLAEPGTAEAIEDPDDNPRPEHKLIPGSPVVKLNESVLPKNARIILEEERKERNEATVASIQAFCGKTKTPSPKPQS